MNTTTLAETPLNQSWTVNAAQAAVSGADVLVVIPVLNEAAHIEACVRSLMAGDARLAEAAFVAVRRRKNLEMVDVL